MPLGLKPECVRCGTRETPLWHATDAGSLCNNCLEDERNTDVNATVKTEEDDKNGLGSKPSRKSTRITRYCKPRSNAANKAVPKGKGRRHIFKKQVNLLFLFNFCYFYYYWIIIFNFTRQDIINLRIFFAAYKSSIGCSYSCYE